jgi:hypothetical protein
MGHRVINATVLIGLLLVVKPLSAQLDEMGGRRVVRFPADPTIIINYGLSNLSLKNFDVPLSDPGMIELKLGFSDLEYYKRESGIVDYMGRYLSVSYITPDLGEGDVNGALGLKQWRFGLESERGYGYRLSSSPAAPAILLLHNSGLTWSDVSMLLPSEGLTEKSRTERFEGGVRFGSVYGAGLAVQVNRVIALNAAFERSQIYERHLFLKWLSGVIIEGGTQGLVDKFVERIIDSSPEAGPVVNFILKNGLGYGLYELRKGNMHWPFSTAEPLHVDTFKFGVTFIF